MQETRQMLRINEQDALKATKVANVATMKSETNVPQRRDRQQALMAKLEPTPQASFEFICKKKI